MTVVAGDTALTFVAVCSEAHGYAHFRSRVLLVALGAIFCIEGFVGSRRSMLHVIATH
jgi:hypothetical protein